METILWKPPEDLENQAFTALETGNMRRLSELAFSVVWVTALSLIRKNEIPKKWAEHAKAWVKRATTAPKILKLAKKERKPLFAQRNEPPFLHSFPGEHSKPQRAPLPEAELGLFWTIASDAAESWAAWPGRNARYLELSHWSFRNWVTEQAEWKLKDEYRNQSRHPGGLFGLPKGEHGLVVINQTRPDADRDPNDEELDASWLDYVPEDDYLLCGNSRAPEHRQRPDERCEIEEIREGVQRSLLTLPSDPQEPLRDLIAYLLAEGYEFGQQGAQTPHILAQFARRLGKKTSAAQKWRQAALERPGFLRHLKAIDDDSIRDAPLKSRSMQWARVRCQWREHPAVAPYLAMPPAGPDPGEIIRRVLRAPKRRRVSGLWARRSSPGVKPDAGHVYTAEQRRTYEEWTAEHPGQAMPALVPWSVAAFVPGPGAYRRN